MKAFWLNYPNVKNRVDLHLMLLLQRQRLPLPIASTEWMEACGLPQNGVNWTAAYPLAFKSTRNTKLREFQFNFCTGDCQQLTFGVTLTNKGNPRCSFFFKKEQEKLTPFLELPYNKIFLGKRNSAPKLWLSRSFKTIFPCGYCSSNWFKACFVKVTSTWKFLPS